MRNKNYKVISTAYQINMSNRKMSFDNTSSETYLSPFRVNSHPFPSESNKRLVSRCYSFIYRRKYLSAM